MLYPSVLLPVHIPWMRNNTMCLCIGCKTMYWHKREQWNTVGTICHSTIARALHFCCLLYFWILLLLLFIFVIFFILVVASISQTILPFNFRTEHFLGLRYDINQWNEREESKWMKETTSKLNMFLCVAEIVNRNRKTIYSFCEKKKEEKHRVVRKISQGR